MNGTLEYQLLLELGVLLLVALLCATIFQKLKMPPVMGMLIAGIIIGPFTPGFKIVSEWIIIMGQLGAILILFGLGLEFKYKDIKTFGMQGLALAGLSGFAGFAAGILLGFLLNWSMAESLLLGALFVSTSSTIALKMMEERPQLNESRGGMITKSAIVFDDLYGFIALAIVLALLQNGTGVNSDVAISIGRVLISIIAIFSVGIFLMPKVFKYIEKIFAGSAIAFGISFCLLLSYAFFSLGISPLIGAFLAGTILTTTVQYKNVLTSLIPVRNLFATVFFVSIGLTINPFEIIYMLPVALLVSLVAIFSKALMFTFILTRANISLKDAFILGLTTGPRGELSLIITQAASLGGLVSPLFLSVAASLVLLTALISSMLLLLFHFIIKYAF